MIEEYGAYTLTYQLTSERFLKTSQTSRSVQEKRVAELNEEETEKQRLDINAQVVVKRKKGYKGRQPGGLQLRRLSFLEGITQRPSGL